MSTDMTRPKQKRKGVPWALLRHIVNSSRLILVRFPPLTVLVLQRWYMLMAKF